MRTLLSATGSDRATAYNMSSKIVRRDDLLFVGWLDCPPEPSAPTRIMLGVCDGASGVLLTKMQVGEGSDNHCGPALALDSTGRMHLIVGAHHGPFLYRWSDMPEIETSWSAPEPLGPFDTYPALAVEPDGTLHLAHREQAERWQLWYRRKRPGRSWETPRPLAISPTPGYNHYMQSLSIGPTGSLHLTLQFHYAESGRAQDCKGYAAAHLQSDDGGDTWLNNGATRCPLPVQVDQVDPICRYPEGGIGVSNHIVDAQNHPWLSASDPHAPSGILWQHTATGWKRHDLSRLFPHPDFHTQAGESVSRDVQGRLHVMVAARPDGLSAPWFAPEHELFHLVFDAQGAPLSMRRITPSDPQVSNWLPALEKWIWNPALKTCLDGLWLLYTHGLNQGGIGGNNRNTIATEIYLTKLAEK